MSRLRVVMALVLLVGATTDAAALDHKNLDAGRPVRLDDAYSIAVGEVSIEAGAGFRLSRRDDARGVFPIELLWGALPNLDIKLGTALFTDAGSLDDRPRSGDLHLGALYNFNQETLWVPAFAAKTALVLPTGDGSTGFGVELGGVATRSIGRLALHVNAGYLLLTDSQRGERDGRYELALGASYPIGAPQWTRSTLVGDLFVEQAIHRGERETVGVELGVRHQLTPRIVWDLGVGTDIAGPRDRSQFTLTTGVSVGF